MTYRRPTLLAWRARARHALAMFVCASACIYAYARAEARDNAPPPALVPAAAFAGVHARGGAQPPPAPPPPAPARDGAQAPAPAPLHARKGDPLGEPIRRRVLALVDGAGKGWELDVLDQVHLFAETPLNHLGMVVVRHDIRDGPPPDELLEGTRAVLTWFGYTTDPPDWLWTWLEERARPAGVRFLHLGDFGPLVAVGKPDDEVVERLRGWLAPFGLETDSGFVQGPVGVEIEYRDRALCTLEGDALPYAVHRGPWSVADGNRVWLTTRVPGPGHRARHPVVTGPWGGIALAPWVATEGEGDDVRRVHLDLFAFFAEALGLAHVPAPHPGVLNGRRMFFCHIDGDGFESLSTIRRGAMCGRVMLDEVLDRYRLPFTVSVIVAGLTHDLEIEEPTQAMRTASEIFRRDNVETASHGVIHPFWWNRPLAASTPEEPVTGYPGLSNYTYSAVAEVRESFRFITERLAPPEKPCRVMLWTGTAAPDEAAIAETHRLGGVNLNGGVFRWDALHDSIGYVSPWGRVVGSQVQVYAGAANENSFKGFFTTLPSAFGHIDETLERCGPRFLKPANVYIHFYSAQKPGRLRALQKLLQRWGVEEPTAPVFVSTYAKAVRSAMTGAAILPTERGWKFRDFGGCRTIRIDAEPRDVDFAASRGVLGARRIDASLYVHLAAEHGEIVLAESPESRPHVEQANHVLREVELRPAGLTLTSASPFRREIVFAGLPPGGAVTLRIDDESRDASADDTGRLRLTLADAGSTRVEVSLR